MISSGDLKALVAIAAILLMMFTSLYTLHSFKVESVECVECGYVIKEDINYCYKCTTKVRNNCEKCGKNLDKFVGAVVCPYCAEQVLPVGTKTDIDKEMFNSK